MRLTLVIAGLELDVTLGPATAETDEGAALNGGTLVGTPISFTPPAPAPMEWQPPERTIPWPEEE